MSINSKINLGWNGKDYPIKMTMEVVGLLEDNDIHLIVSKCAAANPPLVKISKLISAILVEAGANVTVEEVYEAVHGEGETGRKAIIDMLGLLRIEMMPEPKKKPTKPRKKKTTSKKGK